MSFRINWFSNSPAAATGYGCQTKLFVPRLAKMLEGGISVTAFFGVQAGLLNIGGVKIYPSYRDPFGRDIINAHAIQDGADAIITLVDAWVIKPDTLTKPWFPWFPVDHEPMPDNVRRAVAGSAKGITMSKFGLQMAKDAGLDCWYIPHGIETNVFKPVDRVEARERVKFPQDKFIVGMVAANKGNPSRKAFTEQIAAFSALHKAHPDTFMYLHTYDGAGGGENFVDLPMVIKRFGLKLGVDVVFSDQYMNILGFPDEYMVDMYNSFDVLTNVSRGEGFGIPIIEAQACGTPVIVGDWTSMGELCMSGWKVAKKDAMPIYEDRFDAFQYQATTESIYALMEEAYQHRGDMEMRNAARNRALKYDADTVAERYWKPVLKEMEQIVNAKCGGMELVTF